MDNKKCYIYTRVSTAAQVDGYSLDAQLEALRSYAEYRDLEICNEYCDAGVSGGSVSGRQSFQKMMSDVVEQRDNISFVLVFKLSRFGRNCADVLKYMQLLQDYGVDLVSVNESIDSSTQSGKLMLTIMAAVCEMEKENIRSQFMAGKLCKVINGGWHGGPVPYGYRSVNKELAVEKNEAEIIQLIFNLYAEDNASLRSVCRYLDEHGYERIYRGKRVHFNDRFIADLLDNPVYCGKFFYNKRSGTGAEVIEINGIHEPVVSEELWNKVKKKREKCSVCEKKWDKDRVSLLTGVIKCPACGAGMISVVSRTKNKNHGGMYKPVYGYACQNRDVHRYKVCGFRRQYNQEKVDAAVHEMVGRIGTLQSFHAMLEREFEGGEPDRLRDSMREIRKRIYCKESEKERLGIKMDNLDVSGENYFDLYEEYEHQMEVLYDELAELESSLEKFQDRLEKAECGLAAGENIKQLLSNFIPIFDRMTCFEKKEFYHSLIERIEVYPEIREDGRLIKSITFKFPVIYEGEERVISEGNRDHFIYTLDCSKIGMTRAESHATYEMIRNYVQDRYGLRVNNLYIAQIKRKYGLIERRNYHVSKKENQTVPSCPKEKEKCIVAALRHFRDIE